MKTAVDEQLSAAKPIARRIKKAEFAGAGAAIQGFGLLMPVAGFFILGIIGVVGGLIGCMIMFFVGSQKSITWRCESCRNRLVDKQVLMCPTCGSNLTDR